jgi:hypothetical protein
MIFYLEILAGRNSNRRRKNVDTLKISLHVRQKWYKFAVSDIFARTKLKLAQTNFDILNISLHVQKMVQFADRWGLN